MDDASANVPSQSQRTSVERALRADPIDHPAPGKAPQDRARDRGEQDDLRLDLAPLARQAGGDRDVDRVERHVGDHRVVRVGIEDAADQEANQPGVPVSVAQRLHGLARRFADHRQSEDRARARVAAFVHEQETRDRKHGERDRDDGEEQRVILRAEDQADPDRQVRAEIADPDADAADAAPVRLGADFRQQRVVELQTGLIRGIGDHEQHRGYHGTDRGPARPCTRSR